MALALVRGGLCDQPNFSKMPNSCSTVMDTEILWPSPLFHRPEGGTGGLFGCESPVISGSPAASPEGEEGYAMPLLH